MTINSKILSPLYLAFKANEEALVSTIRESATKSASLMGERFNKVYHRSSMDLFTGKLEDSRAPSTKGF